MTELIRMLRLKFEKPLYELREKIKPVIKKENLNDVKVRYSCASESDSSDKE